MAGTTTGVSNRTAEQVRERAARARYLVTIAREFVAMNTGRSAMEQLTGDLRHVGELRAAIMAWDAMGKGS